MRCEDFRIALLDEAISDEALAHLRSCESCLNIAVEQDPDLMFRALGGELEPPGGVEAFSAEVMQQIHVRDTERRLVPRDRGIPAFQRWALAAAAVMMFVTGGLLWRAERGIQPGSTVSPVNIQAAAVESTVVRPVVERWDSSNAMIIEIPEEETSDLKVVMVFDESLPADL